MSGLVAQPEQPPCVLPSGFQNIEHVRDFSKEMTRSTDTRFVIITHNHITMALMKCLYGVTMTERGVLQLAVTKISLVAES